MKTLSIKKSGRYLLLEIINTLIFLTPAIYFLYAYDLHIIGLVLVMIYMLLVIAIAVYVILLRYNTCITIFDNGIELGNKHLFEWAAIESYYIKEEKVRYNSADTGYGYATTQTLYIILRNADLVRFSVDQLNKKPNEIIELFDQRKALNQSLS